MAEAEARAAEEQSRREMAERLQQAAERGRKRANYLAIVASALFLLSAGLGIWALGKQQEARAALDKSEKTEAAKVSSEVNAILSRAKRLKDQYPDIYQNMNTDAVNILKGYPNNSYLQHKLDSIAK
jgi:cytochrome oxidase assembly protein ShyY1